MALKKFLPGKIITVQYHEISATINVSYNQCQLYSVQNKFWVSYLLQNVGYDQECQVILPRNVRYISLARCMKLSGIEMCPVTGVQETVRYLNVIYVL